MSLIKLDLAGSIDPGFGVSQDQLASLAPTMDQLRGDFLAKVQSSPNHFFDLPMQQYEAYQKEREASPLGRVFDVGTGLNDHIDAVVVVGSVEATAAARGIFRSCCDPYHNERSRADRGSRPRIYFAGDTFDNDDLAALMNRLSQRDFRDSPAESRWALLVMDSARDTQSDQSLQLSEESRLAFQTLLRELPDPKRFLFSVVKTGGWLDQQVRSLDCENVFEISGSDRTAEQTLSALSLLPSAMLGLDCIKLLEGAVMMNEHFKTASIEENVVLQFAAIHHLLARDFGFAGRYFRVWPSGLDWLPAWYQSLRQSENDYGASEELRLNRSTVTNWIAKKPRYDSVELGDGSLVDKMAASWSATDLADRVAKRPAITIELPTLDTRVLGQIFQMLLIATMMDAQISESSALPSSV